MALVLTEFDGALAHLVLNRPREGNAVSPPLAADLATAVDAVVKAAPRAVLLRGEGPNFSFGGDIQHFAAQGADLARTLAELAESVHASLVKLRGIDAPIVCAARGHVLGGGLGVALCSDFLLLSDTARVSTAYARLGFSADAGVSYFLTRAVGARRAAAMLMDSRFLTARECVDLGIADRVLPDLELDAAAHALALELAEGPTAAFAAIRRLTEAAAGGADFSAHLDLEAREITTLAAREGAEETIRAVLRKRKPQFKA